MEPRTTDKHHSKLSFCRFPLKCELASYIESASESSKLSDLTTFSASVMLFDAGPLRNPGEEKSVPPHQDTICVLIALEKQGQEWQNGGSDVIDEVTHGGQGENGGREQRVDESKESRGINVSGAPPQCWVNIEPVCIHGNKPREE